MIVIVDYGMGNLRSVQKAAAFLGAKACITDKPAVIKKADKIIFPGVGHFKKAVTELKQRKLFSLLQERIAKKVTFLGICLGMQLLFENSQEAPQTAGLGVIKGSVEKFQGKLIVPHMGWNKVKIKDKKLKIKNGGIFNGIKDNSFFYFAHSYYCKPKENVEVALTDYGVRFVSSVCKDNIWGVQFHPEKSQAQGLQLLKNFLNILK